MTIAPVGAIGAEPGKAMEQLAKLASNNQQTSAGSSSAVGQGNEIPATVEVQSTATAKSTEPGFTSSVLDSVYTEIDKLSSKVPDAVGKTSPIDTYKNDMASQIETLNPQAEGALKPESNDTVAALSKTFDHAIFMAMVNQVVSGVSDTSRTLIRQN